jgi:hypothetical protein
MSEDSTDACTAIGYNALASQNQTGVTGNTGVGYQTIFNNVTGTKNTALGYRALKGTSSQSGTNITAIGYESLAVAYGQGNTGLGKGSGVALTSGVRNVLIGVGAGATATTSSNMVLIGAFAGDAINSTGADGTVAIGRDSLIALTSGERNVAIGFESLKSNTIGDKNTAVGYQALESFNADTDGHGNNTAIGHNAMQGNTTGTDNIAIGHMSAFSGTNNMTSGDNNTFIGSLSTPSSGTPTNQTVIGYNATGQADNSVTLGNSSVTAVYMAQDSGAVVYCSGVNFPDTQVASGDANTLDDYEEGTYTPILSDGGTTFSCSTATGSYTKIGNQVFVQVTLVTSENGSGSSLQISLPFNYNAGGSNFITASVRTGGIDLDGACVQVMLGNSSSGTSNLLYFTEIRDNFSEATLAGTAMSSGDTIRFNAHYKVA